MENNKDTSKQIIKVQYLLLVRHGFRDKAFDVERSQTRLANLEEELKLQDHGYSVAKREIKGWPLSQSLAGWVAEFLHLWEIKITAVVAGPARDAQDTAQAYLSSFKPQGLCDEDITLWTDPSLRTNFAVLPDEKEPKSHILENFQIHPSDIQGAGKALMLCGHQPHLTWIANYWLRKKKTEPFPLNLSEAFLIRIAPTRESVWVVGNADTEVMAQLENKIKSKLDTAKSFSAFISVMLGLIVAIPGMIGTNDTIKHVKVFSVGMILIFGSLILTLMTLFAYDTLHMPKLFWTSGPKRRRRRLLKFFDRFIPGWQLERPPTPPHWILYSNMVRVWCLLFKPAVISYFIGITLVAYSIVQIKLWPWGVFGFVAMLDIVLLLRIFASVKLCSQD